MVERSRFVRAPAAKALELLSDLSRISEYNQDVSVTSAPVGAASVGQHFALSLKSGPMRLSVTGHVLHVDAQGITLSLRSVLPAIERRSVDEAVNGCTVRWKVTFDVPFWAGGRFAEAWLFRPLTEKNLERELSGVQRILESAL